jgi:Flp pilus assembly protein TadD
LEKCLSPEVDDRPRTAAELAAALRDELRPWRRGQRAVRAHPWRAAAWVFAAVAAVLVALSLIARIPPYSVRQYRQGMAYYERGQWQLAVDRFTESLRSDPHNADTLWVRARALCSAGEFHEAYSDFIAAYELTHAPACYAGMGYCYSKLDRPEVAIVRYDQALKGGYSSPGLLNNLGRALLQRSQLEAAEGYIRQALRQKSDFPAAQENLIVLRWAQLVIGKPLTKDAIDEVEKAAKIALPSTGLYHELAMFYAAAGNKDARLLPLAIGYVDKALDAGLEPRAIRTDAGFTALLESKALDEVLAKRRLAKQPSRAVRIVDPL